MLLENMKNGLEGKGYKELESMDQLVFSLEWNENSIEFSQIQHPSKLERFSPGLEGLWLVICKSNMVIVGAKLGSNHCLYPEYEFGRVRQIILWVLSCYIWDTACLPVGGYRLPISNLKVYIAIRLQNSCFVFPMWNAPHTAPSSRRHHASDSGEVWYYKCVSIGKSECLISTHEWAVRGVTTCQCPSAYLFLQRFLYSLCTEWSWIKVAHFYTIRE